MNTPDPSLKDSGIFKLYYGHRIDSRGKRKNELVQFRKDGYIWYYLETPPLLDSLTRIALEQVPLSFLCDDAEKSMNPRDWIFVKRRNTMAHVAFEKFGLNSQTWQLNTKSEVDWGHS
ncbi:MAG: hypothetical protein ACYDAP_02895 [Thermoplasmataceae archaeon]